MKDIKNTVRMLRTQCPVQFNDLVEYIDAQEKTCNDTLVSAISTDIMRQNQGKTQILRELLVLLRT
jgi:hypothetical protein